MNWVLIAEVVYTLIVIAVCLRIVYDTNSTSKTLAYLLLTVFLPVAGIILYFCVGTNYRKRKLYSKKISRDETMLGEIKKRIYRRSEGILTRHKSELKKYHKLARLLLNSTLSQLSEANQVQLLINGEQKFPEVIRALKEARHHIHIEYYIFEDEAIGNQIKDILIQKAAEGLQVRLIYDDFGSRSIRKRMIPELQKAGVICFPFYRILFIALANRFNYRNHRKIIIIDGHTAFTGGINVSDRYINDGKNNGQIFWRDTHLKIKGEGVYYLQYLFICDWNFCADEELFLQKDYFAVPDAVETEGTVVQIAASGPDSDTPTILFSLLEAIGTSENEILITTPYFIPGESLLDALTVAALGGVKVKLLVPGESDSRMVDFAARSYYGDLISAGVEIYLYQKGFIHAKTMVCDGQLSIVGTANMDHRSFELNFEVNSIVYDADFSNQLRDVFYEDLKNAEQINVEEWMKRPIYREFAEKLARLMSPLL